MTKLFSSTKVGKMNTKVGLRNHKNGVRDPHKTNNFIFVVLILIKTEGEIDSNIFQSFLHPLSIYQKNRHN